MMGTLNGFSRVISASVLIASSAAFAQQGPTVAVPESLKLSRLVDLTAQATGHQYTYTPADLEQTVTLRVTEQLSAQQLQDLTAQVLASRGFAVVQPPGKVALTVVKLENAATAASIGEAPGAGFATEVVGTRHQPAKVLADALRPMVSKPGGSISVLGDSPNLIISDLTTRLPELKELLTKVDVPDTVITRPVRATSLGATQLVALATQAMGKRESAGGRKLDGDLIAAPDGQTILLVTSPRAEAQWLQLLQELDQREAVSSETYFPRSFAAKDVAKLIEAVANPAGVAPPDERTKVVVDDLTGSLIITGTATQHQRITALLARLDSTESTPMPVRSFPIRNRPVSEVLATLQTLIEAGALDSGLADPTSASRAEVSAGSSQTTLRPPLLPQPGLPATTTSILPSAATPSARSGVKDRPPISLTADEPTNTLIAIAEPRMLSQLETLLLTLDVRQPQVMLEVKLVSLTESETLTLGAELERIGSIDNATVRLASLFGLSTGGPAGRVVGDAAGFTGAVLNPGEFSIIVRALETVNQGRSVSNPKVLVSNNEKAVFSSTLQQPIQQQTRTGSNDTFISYGGTENAGTTISVKPQIAQGDHLVLTYSIKLSSFVGTSTNAGLPPPRQENAVDSVATIPDGYTVVVGGLDLVTDGKGESRIPLIGEVPLIGELFKTRNNSGSHTRFFVFIRANVMRSSSFDDLKYISGSDMSRAQVDDGFPEVAPRVIR